MLDLFKPTVALDRLHPNFASLISRPNLYDRAVISNWAEGFIDRDGKFVEEFQTTFNGCFWELYLHAILKEVGCKINFKYNRPDFIVMGPVPFVVEATVALNAKDSLPEWSSFDLNNRPGDLNEFNRVSIIRLLNSISEKSKKYLTSYANLEQVKGKPFVLALTPFDRPFFYMQVQRAVEAVLFDYYVDEQKDIDDPSNYTSTEAKRLGFITKNNGTQLPLGIFNDSSHAHISAILFNSSATWGKVRALCNDPYPFIYFSAARSDPRNGDFFAFQGMKANYHEELMDGLRVYHNPYATYPLDWRIFQMPGAFQAVCENPDTFDWKYSLDRPPLVARNLITLQQPSEYTEEFEKMVKNAQENPKGCWYQVPFSKDLLQKIASAQHWKSLNLS
jgi:hypothetical protein